MRVTRWRGREPVGSIRVRYGRRFFDGEASRRERLEHIMWAKLGPLWRPEWHTRSELVVFHPVAPIPTRVAYADLADVGGQLVLPVGVGHDGRRVSWRVDEQPHALVGGATRRGKSAVTRSLAVTMLRRGWQVVACDPKGVDLQWLAGRPGVVEVTATGDDGSIQPMVAALGRAVDEQADRYRLMRQLGVDRWEAMPTDRRPPPLARHPRRGPMTFSASHRTCRSPSRRSAPRRSGIFGSSRRKARVPV